MSYGDTSLNAGTVVFKRAIDAGGRDSENGSIAGHRPMFGAGLQQDEEMGFWSWRLDCRVTPCLFKLETDPAGSSVQDTNSNALLSSGLPITGNNALLCCIIYCNSTND